VVPQEKAAPQKSTRNKTRTNTSHRFAPAFPSPFFLKILFIKFYEFTFFLEEGRCSWNLKSNKKIIKSMGVVSIWIEYYF
jgi:hypothetical protein